MSWLASWRKNIKRKLGPLGAFGTHLVLGSILAIGSILLFTQVAEDLLEHKLNHFDAAITNFIVSFNTPLLTNIMKAITTFGAPLVLCLLALLAYYLLYRHRKHFWDAAMLIIAFSGGWLLDELLKFTFHRPRPPVVLRLVEVGGYSFPSGHTMVSASFYGFLAYLVWLNLKHPKARLLTITGLITLIFFIGISRIYLGAHYPSDVLAGYAAGTFWVTSCILALQTIRYYKSGYR